MKKVIGYLIACLLFYSVLVAIRIFGLLFLFNKEKVETTPQDLLPPLAFTAIWIVLMIVFKGIKIGKVQKTEV